MAEKDVTTEAEKLNAYLFEDVKAACKLCQADPSQFNCRTVIRTMFASLEAMTFGLKRTILTLYPQRLSLADLALLQEETYTLDNKGEVQSQQKFLPLDANFRYAIKTFIKVFQVDVVTDFGGKEWKAFREAVKVRNRITHPKNAQDCHVSKTDEDNVEMAFNWAYRLIVECDLKYLHKLVVEMREAGTPLPD